MKLRIGIIFGGRSGEHEVSLATATSVMNALDPAKYEIVPIGITKSGKWLSSSRTMGLLKSGASLDDEEEKILLPDPTKRRLQNIETTIDDRRPTIDPRPSTLDPRPSTLDPRPSTLDQNRIDIVFPLIHGKYGEDGTLQGLLELTNIPYVGAGVLASAVGMDKVVQKQVFAAAGLPLAPYVWYTASQIHEHIDAAISQIEDVLGYPCFVKPANTGSSVGITKAHDRAELVEGLEMAMQFDRKIVIEKGLNDAREIECAVLGNDDPQASVLGEVVPSNEFYDYNAKYVDGASTIIIPAPLPAEITEQIRQLAVQAFRSIDCAGMARVDFFVQKVTNEIMLNEVNTIPGFTAISMYPKLWEASGVKYADLLDKLIQLAIERHKEMSALATEYKPDKKWYDV